MVIGDMSWVTSPSTFALAGLILIALGVYRAITTGKLVPAATVARRESDWEARLTEGREREKLWQEAYQVSEDARRDQAAQIEQLLVLGRTTEALLRALPSGRTPP